MTKENLILKRRLILQSFLPLYIMLFIKYFDFGIFSLTRYFIYGMLKSDWELFQNEFRIDSIWCFLLCLYLFLCIVRGVFAVATFVNMQKSGLYDTGEKIKTAESMEESSLGFFITFIIPLLFNDIASFRGILIFAMIMICLFLLMWKTNLYYQNPVLVILGYHIYKVTYKNPITKTNENKEVICIVRGNLDCDHVFTRKYISDNVYYVVNKK